MNIITNSVLIFIFIFVSLIIGVPGLENDNLLKNKFYLFCGVFIFQLMLKSIYKIKYNCKNREIKSIVNEAIITGIFSVIGYSIYIDLLNMSDTREIILPYVSNQNTHALLIASVISLFILCSKSVEIIVTNKKDEC
jgi:hypothetical protein